MSCLICNDRIADKTGSHVIPHFIVASMINSGASGRDSEQSFRLNSNGSNFFFGRSVLPEDLEDTLGRPVNDEEIESNAHHYVMDNIFCTPCEEMLSHLESIYSSEIVPMINNESELSESQVKILLCFWLSVILRCSVTRFSNFRLEQPIQEYLREMINDLLAESIEQVRQNCIEADIEKDLIVLVHPNPDEPSRNFTFCHPNKINPYLLIINDYIIVFNWTYEGHLNDLEQELGIALSHRISNYFGYFSNSERENVIRYCSNVNAQQMLNNILNQFRRAYFENHREAANPEIVSAFVDELIYDDSVPVTIKYTPERIRSLINKYGG